MAESPEEYWTKNEMMSLKIYQIQPNYRVYLDHSGAENDDKQSTIFIGGQLMLSSCYHSMPIQGKDGENRNEPKFIFHGLMMCYIEKQLPIYNGPISTTLTTKSRRNFVIKKVYYGP